MFVSILDILFVETTDYKQFKAPEKPPESRLEIDRHAAQQRAEQAAHLAQLKRDWSNKIHNWTHKEVEHALSYHLRSVLEMTGLNSQTTYLLDLLVSPSITFSKLELALIDMPWLKEQLLSLFHSGALTPGKKPSGIIHQTKTMLNLVGFDNAQIIVPQLLFKRSLPSLTEPFPQTKGRILDFTTAFANSLYLAFADQPRLQLPMMLYAYHSQLSTNVMIKLFFKAFEQVKYAQMLSAEKARLQIQHDVIQTIQPDSHQCAKLIREYSTRLTDAICRAQSYQRLPIQALHEQLQQDESVAKPVHACEQMATLAVANKYLKKDYSLVDCGFWQYCRPNVREQRSQYDLTSPTDLLKR